jgi:predicted tellurium resistance membrane protein TerC
MDLLTGIVVPFVALTAMEIVLGIDNIVFIVILTDRLPADQQPRARRLGLGAAMMMRILLLMSLKWVLGLTEPVLQLSFLGLPEGWVNEEMNHISVRDLILLGGGLFLIAKSVHEIHMKVEGHEESHAASDKANFAGVLAQIAALDIIFSLDSVITAVGMVKDIRVMIAAVIVAVIVMMVFAGTVSHFVKKHPTLKILALSFLILIGVLLVAEGIGSHFDKGYVYFAMAFSLVVEILNISVARRREALAKS